MAKRKNNIRINRIEMQNRRNQLEKEIFKTMLRIVNACNAMEKFKRLPASEIRFLKTVHYYMAKIRAEKGSGISDAVISAVKKDLSNYLRSEKVTLEGSNEAFTMYDIVTAGQTLWHVSRFCKEPEWKPVYEALGPLNRFFESKTDIPFVSTIYDFLQNIIMNFSRVDRYFLWFTYNTEYKNHHLASIFTMHRQPCIRRNIVVDQKKRPVFRVGYSVNLSGMKWACVKGELLHQFRNDADENKEYPVYIQSHALERMKERLFPLHFYEMLLNSSFLNPEISYGPTGNLLFAVKGRECKIGYLLTDFNKNELVIRTFLFITQTGTKEGLALNERLRIETYSKKYFELDSLLTYITTNICIDPFFRSILIECGCEGLVTLKNAISSKHTKDDNFARNLRHVLALEDQEYEYKVEKQEELVTSDCLTAV